MDCAINATTNEYLIAWLLETNISYPFIEKEIWYADPNEILSYDKSKVNDITKIEVRFRKGNEGVINKYGTEYSIAPCFFIPNKTKLGINIIPESKEHKLVKNWIYNKIKNKNLKFIYSSVKRPREYDNELDIKYLDIDYNKIGIEITVKNNKTNRADVIIPFKNLHPVFGTGIVIEVQFSNQYESTTHKRNLEWAFKGYSVCWVWKDDFENISDSIIEIKDEKLKLEPVSKILNEFKEKSYYELREFTQDLSRKIDMKMNELNYPFVIGNCLSCNSGYMIKHKGKGGKKDWYGCSNWRSGCKHTISIDYD